MGRKKMCIINFHRETRTLLLTNEVAKCNAFSRPKRHCPFTPDMNTIKAHNHIPLRKQETERISIVLRICILDKSVLQKPREMVASHSFTAYTRLSIYLREDTSQRLTIEKGNAQWTSLKPRKNDFRKIKFILAIGSPFPQMISYFHLDLMQ